MKRRRVGLAVTAVVLLALATAAWGAFAPLPTTSRELTYVIPPGTAARVKAGTPVTVLPSPVHLTVGFRDTLVLTNDDEVIHQLGPVILGPRQTYRIPFRRPGRFQYACSLHAAGTLTLLIDPEPAAGLARLRWRLEHAFGLHSPAGGKAVSSVPAFGPWWPALFTAGGYLARLLRERGGRQRVCSRQRETHQWSLGSSARRFSASRTAPLSNGV